MRLTGSNFINYASAADILTTVCSYISGRPELNSHTQIMAAKVAESHKSKYEGKTVPCASHEGIWSNRRHSSTKS
jgi:hypothetical protein